VIGCGHTERTASGHLGEKKTYAKTNEGNDTMKPKERAGSVVLVTWGRKKEKKKKNEGK